MEVELTTYAPWQDHRRFFHSRAGGLAPLQDVQVAEAELCDGCCLVQGYDLYTEDLVTSRLKLTVEERRELLEKSRET